MKANEILVESLQAILAKQAKIRELQNEILAVTRDADFIAQLVMEIPQAVRIDWQAIGRELGRRQFYR